LLIGFSILLDAFRREPRVQPLIENGENPMITYAGINNLIIPVLALTTVNRFLSSLVSSPELGFVRGASIPRLLALSVSFFAKQKTFWRS
jgi:hypothetical protein